MAKKKAETKKVIEADTVNLTNCLQCCTATPHLNVGVVDIAEHGGADNDGRTFNAVARQLQVCTKCEQHRVEITYVYADGR